MTPFESNPYQLISWWNMERFSAESFYNIGYLLAEAKHLAFQVNEDSITGTQLRNAERLFKLMLDHCRDINLRLTAKAIERALKHFTGKTTIDKELFTGALDDVDGRVQDEMEDALFMYVPTERAAFYNKRELFGKDVNTRFPAIQYDMVESGNCYASGRSTACVFHLMRVMETGVQEFGTSLGVPLVNEKVWQVILDQINKAIKALDPKDPKTKEMAEASCNLYSVKLAWRNEVMHPKDTYTLEEAENIIRQVKIFMEQLAKII